MLSFWGCCRKNLNIWSFREGKQSEVPKNAVIIQNEINDVVKQKVPL